MIRQAIPPVTYAPTAPHRSQSIVIPQAQTSPEPQLQRRPHNNRGSQSGHNIASHNNGGEQRWRHDAAPLATTTRSTQTHRKRRNDKGVTQQLVARINYRPKDFQTSRSVDLFNAQRRQVGRRHYNADRQFVPLFYRSDTPPALG